MNLKRFDEIIAAYGGDSARWPSAERAGALRLLDQSDEARNRLVEARELDTLLDGSPEASADLSSLRASILANTIYLQGEKSADSLLDRIADWLVPMTLNLFWRPAAMATLTLLLGITIGQSNLFFAEDLTETWDDEISMMALDDNYGGLLDE